MQHHAVSHCLPQVLKFRIYTGGPALDLFSKQAIAQNLPVKRQGMVRSVVVACSVCVGEVSLTM